MVFDAPASPPPVAVVVERESHYDIHARDEPGLVKEMSEKGPTRPEGHFWAYTSVDQTFRYDTRMQGASCVLEKPEVRVSVNVVYPSWEPPAGVRPAVVTKWNALSAAIHRHEGEHIRLARSAAASLGALVTSYPAYATCDKLDAYIKHGAEVIDAKQKHENQELDSRTRHGASEGVAISW